MEQRFGCIGCGNMGGNLAKALSERIPDDKIFLYDTDAEKAARLAAKIGGIATSLDSAVNNCDYLILGVKPQSMETLFADLQPLLFERKKKPILVSMAVGVPMAKITELAKDDSCPIIRIMPNLPVSVGAGMIVFDHNEWVSETDADRFCHAMDAAGRFDRIPESLIDAASALSGCGPAFVCLFAEALADGAVACGLPREKANLYAAQTIFGSAKMLLETQKHPGEWKDAVCSPGGTTIAGVRALENGAFRADAMNAVIAAYEKALSFR